MGEGGGGSVQIGTSYIRWSLVHIPNISRNKSGCNLLDITGGRYIKIYTRWSTDAFPM